MNRGILVALALLAAAPVHAQDEVKQDSTATKAKPAAKPGTKKGKADAKPTGKKAEAGKKGEAGGSSAWGTGGGGAKGSVASKQSATAAPHAADRAAMLRARAVYRYAVETCTQAGKSCETALRDDAELKFIDACLPCATRAQCEAERDLIRAGDAKSTTALCTQ